MKSYMIRIKAETMGPVKYVVEISTGDDLNSEVQTKRYEEKSGLSQDLIDCLPQFGDSEQLLRTVDQQKSLVLSETPIELSEDCASRLGWFESTL